MIDSRRIKLNLANIKENIKQAAYRSGRIEESIKLLAVTKQTPLEWLEILIQENIFDFAENKVQEFLKKYDKISKKVNWHFIGRLQTNKVKYIIDKVCMIHSLDRIELAEEIDLRARHAGKTMDVLVQVNVSGEVSKAGVDKTELIRFLRDIAQLPNLKVCGLMTMAPHTEDLEKIRSIFQEIFNLTIDVKTENLDNISMDFLSMGMSNDYQIAIEEGANIVRLGSAIFKQN